ncbi:hypothetical protein PPL_10282 [Heterostelium album PN500]|uniref:EF-1-gamma C-terminal domain-containing protein n=1 Tax=Heterostelium pallidum (strain ATCC 26659 / Pp 5 / PN500) TaxID=670386 RepID=D3BQU4_HETP5|nr:hypothetical protein PPL_10282 [Heterostelium album PN500]EFA76514.1 hypothetical protein PPL_10282 [Heterostelium album PN500]|eukprot:XP_020428646.1 hypothetical protein PPL_10282 [Heterostelium album PN500]
MSNQNRAPHPLSLLPPSNFNLAEWKIKYMNEDVRTVALPWFWQNFDAEGYCVYFASYLYCDELGTVVYKTQGLINGMFQRLESLRKWAFASVLITGDKIDGDVENQELTGIWIFRGQELPQDLKDYDDYINFNWHHLDIRDPLNRTLIEDYLAWDGDLGGRKFIQGQIYK